MKLTLQVYEGKRSKAWRGQRVAAEQSQGYTVHREFIFISDDEFKRDFGKGCLSPKDVGLQSEAILDERGQVVYGVLLRHPSCPYRVVRAWGNYGHAMEEEVHQSAGQLRRDQGAEVFETCCSHAAKERAQSLKGAASLDEEGLRVLVAKHLKQREEAAAIAAVLPPAVEVKTEPKSPVKKEEADKPDRPLIDFESDLEEEDGEMEASLPLPLVGAAKRKAKDAVAGKAKAKAKSKGKEKTGALKNKAPDGVSSGPPAKRLRITKKESPTKAAAPGALPCSI